jgi:hypothetical protein
MKENDYYTLKLPNNKKYKFRTREAFSSANEALAKGRFSSVDQMVDCIKNCSTGFEYANIDLENNKGFKKKSKENNFNQIDFED